MKAVIMAGGEGTRLRPLTIHRPKPMVTVVDRPVLHHIIELLKLHGITDIIITLQYLANTIQDYYGDGSSYGVNITYSVEETPMGTAGSVKQAAHLLKEPFLVISGDALTDFDLSSIVQAHNERHAMATMTLTRVANPLEYGVVVTDEEGHVLRLLEKPSWGEVVSDTVNTGVYIFDPSVLDMVESGRVEDWSRDIFPRMMRDKRCVIGHIAEGYWTDIGTIEEYVRASNDYLSDKVRLPRVGSHLGGGLWVGDDVQIAPDAQLHGPIYLGHGVRIKSGAVINGPSVIRDYTIIDEHAGIDRSIVWRNSYVGERAELRGAVVLRQCTIRKRAMVFEGAVIGDEVQIGSGAIVHPHVKIWPNKEVDEGATVSTSLIWGSRGRRVLFNNSGISGLVNIDITPEFCSRISTAFATTLPQGANVVINRDSHYIPRMLKRAIIAGLPAAGVNVLDVRTVPVPVARFFVHESEAVGGIYVRLSPGDPRAVDIVFFDRRGLDISPNLRRQIEQTYFREDYRRVQAEEIGRIAYGQDAEESYIKAFLHALNKDVIEHLSTRQERAGSSPLLIADYANGAASGMMSAIFRRLRLDVVELNANMLEDRLIHDEAQFEEGIHRLTQMTPVLESRMGVRFDNSGEKVALVDNKGRYFSGMQSLAVVIALALRAHGGGTVAVPVTAPRVFEELAERHGGRVIRTKSNLGALMHLAADRPDMLVLGDGAGHYIFPAFYPIADGMFATVKILELLVLNDTSLNRVVKQLPAYHMHQLRVPCGWEHKGRVMRLLSQHYQERRQDTGDGIRIDLGDEWVVIQPDADGPYFRLIAEGTSDDRARMLAEKYAGLIAGL